MNKLEEAAREYIRQELERRNYINFHGITPVENAFLDGAEWQKNNMWISVDEDLPYVGKQCFVITKNGKCSVSNMYIPKDCYGNVLGGKEWKGSPSFKESIVAWMAIPEIKKGGQL